MNVKEILNQVETFNENRNYWFIRTDAGKHFDIFYEGNYIAIGWDYLSLNDIFKKSDSEIKEIIGKKEDLDSFDSIQKGKITAIFNKISTFLKLRKGDIIIVPSRNSERLAFGEIVETEPYEDTNAIEMGNYFKRRKVKWLELKSIFEVDAIFYQLKSNQHAISRVDRFAPYIDKVVGNLFKKGDKTHYILNVEKQDDINFRDLNKLMDNIEDIINEINREFKFDENLDDFFVKINLQSPGKLELIKAGKSLAILAYLLNLVSCGIDPKTEKDPQIKSIATKIEGKLDNTKIIIDTLDIDTNDLTQPFASKTKKDGK